MGVAGQELEFKLAAHDAAVLDDVERLRDLGGYRLTPRPRRAIHDLYWDTHPGDLAALHMSLRLRDDGGAWKLTFKRTLSADEGLFRRREVEMPATPENWVTIKSELVADGAPLRAIRAVGANPMVWLRREGLAVTQDRRTDRRVLIADDDGEHVAELALDSTTFRAGVFEVVFREVEVEALGEDVEHIVKLAEALQLAFPGRFSPSKQGKYSLGLKLAARLADL